MPRPLLPGEYAVLALLTLQPMHGYDMARYFREDLAEVCPLEQSLLYSYIRNLEGRGLVAWTEERVGLRPPRKVYELTTEGLAEAEKWLHDPVDRLREVRMDFLVKMSVLHRSNPAAERVLLERQIAFCDDYRQRLATQLARSEGFDALVAGSKVSAADATLQWLRAHAEQEVGG